MGFLSRKYKPVALMAQWPSMTQIPLPDMRVLKKHAERVQMTNDIVLPEAQDPQIREFGKELAVGLYEVWATDLCFTDDDHERLLGAVGVAVCLGLAYSGVDNGLGMRPGNTEQCTQAAVVMGMSFLDDLPKPWQLPLFYSLQAGHFLGRMGRSVTPQLIAKARL